MTLSPGTRLGPYEIQAAVGAGGMGEVYKAKDTRLERSVAIKVLPAHFSADPERRARFAREAKAIGGLNHRHICALHDVGREGDIDFLVMEYVDGTRLASTYPVAKALEYAIQIVDALRASHQNGVIHRDLKPANVMVTPEGQVKVLDFGLAKHLAAPAAPEAATVSAPSDEASLTRHGVAVGTVPYMSPEQVEGKPLDARSDIFSFGAVLYELLTGKRAFQGDSAISTMSAILHETPVGARKVRHEVPRRLEAILNRCLEKSRDARYASAADLHEELEGCEAELLGRSTSKPCYSRALPYRCCWSSSSRLPQRRGSVFGVIALAGPATWRFLKSPGCCRPDRACRPFAWPARLNAFSPRIAPFSSCGAM